ncbi:hypothetical protein KQH61_03880 [bacterium]|nr:hypothetical protein [bacterium]MCB2179042.1 hypothetical protein [bacterium]
MKSLDFYQRLANQMVTQDLEKDRMMAAMEAMWQARWQLPEKIAALRWMHKVISTDPHDALRAGVRVLSGAEPRIKVLPVGLGVENHTPVEDVERALAGLFHQANRRRQASVLRDILLSALLYDEVVAQVVYLPNQIKALRMAGGDTKHLEAARRSGAFAVLVRNPRQVSVRYSDWMPEAVLYRQVMPVEDVVAFWGDQAHTVRQLQSKDNGLLYASVYDYMDLENRVVWAYLHEDHSPVLPGAGLDGSAQPVEVVRQAHGLGFLPWVARVGGTTLAHSPAEQRIPLLYSVYKSGQWETQNVLETLLTSEVIAYAAAPRMKVEGATDQVVVDYGEPGRMAHVPPGHSLEPMSPPGMDASLAEIADRVSQRIDKSTVPRILQTGDFPTGTAFATLNLATQSGLKSLAPYKELAEKALEGILMQMLDWIALDGRPVLTYSHRRDGSGGQVVLDPAKVDSSRLMLEVELTADVPADQAARIEAAATAVRELGYSRTRALEFIGEPDPTFVLEEAHQEALTALEHELELKKLRANMGYGME